MQDQCKFDMQYPENHLILAERVICDLDDCKTKLNNNVVVVGSPGSGKSSSVVLPNIYQASGSYLISDPKGYLYEETADYLQKRGYEVLLLDLKNPTASNHYNPLAYIRTIQDIMTLASLLAHQSDRESFSGDPFWDQAAFGLYTAVLAYLVFECPVRQRTLANMTRLISMMDIEDTSKQCELDKLFEHLQAKKPDTFAYIQYRKIRVCPTKTLQSIIITAQASLLMLENPELNVMTASDDVCLSTLGDTKKAVFLVVSDSDRSMDVLANIFFTQAMNELCCHADQDCGGRLPVPVRFILDDFGTNLKINEFPKFISSIRSRGISTMLILQSEGQLKAEYKDNAATIIAGCDTYVYTGGNDLETAKAVAERTNDSIQNVLSQEIGKVRIIRRGQSPIYARSFDIWEHRKNFKYRIPEKKKNGFFSLGGI